MNSRTALLGFALLTAAGAALAADDATTVAVTGGSVHGVVDGAVLSFKGVPFAQPPVGALRWRAPQPVARWSGVLQASQPGHDCMQIPFPSDAAPLGTEPSEDCLVLNVWRPAASAAKLPVIVWIYGGGFVNGGSSPAVYDGSEFARQGVVFVSFNYRLGRFGFFAHPALSSENRAREPLGNYAYMDQLAALRWVRRNVSAFGGDPSQVTIVGESAGGGSVHALLGASAAKGLFKRAVIMSGGGRGSLMGQRALARDKPNLPSGETIGLNFATSVGIEGKNAAALAALRALPAEKVVAGVSLGNMMRGPSKDAPTYAGPMQDGRIVTAEPDKLYASGRFNHADLMVGATSGDIGGFNVMGEPSRYVGRLFAKQGLHAYVYRFSYVADSMAAEWKNGAPHASDIPYFFNTVAAKYGANLTPKDAAVGKFTATYLANFAKHGDPNGAGLPTWPAQSATGAELMDLSKEGVAVGGTDPRQADMDAAEAAAKAPPKPPAPAP